MTSELLVAIDRSKHSERIVKYTSSLAKRLNAKIVLVYVVPESRVPDEYREFARIENIGELEYFDELSKAILKKHSSILKEEGIEHETLTDLGNTAERIILLAQKRNSEMIIVGLQELHGLSKVRSLESVSRRIVENSPIPIIIVP
jgi:nucleotide-binding universal stress UspA family protein